MVSRPAKPPIIPSVLINDDGTGQGDVESYHDRFRKKYIKSKKQALINTEFTLPPHLTFVSDVLFGVFGLLTQSIDNCPAAMSYKQLGEVCALLHEFYSSHGFTVFSSLLQEIASLSNQSGHGCKLSNKSTSSPVASPVKSSLYAKKPETCYYLAYVNLLSIYEQLISAIQKSKIEYMHKVDCSRHNHKSCDLTKLVPVHHNLLGYEANQYLTNSTTDQFDSATDKVCDHLKTVNLGGVK